MKAYLPFLLLALATGMISCGGDPPPQANQGVPIQQNPGNATPVVSNNSAKRERIEGDAPPADAEYTIFCKVVIGPNHILTASHWKEQLMGKDGGGLHAWHIIHAADQSMLFYGYYKTFDDKDHYPAEVARAQGDLHRVEALKDDQGAKLFPTAMFLPINQPDPDAPPQWDLAKTPSWAYWSLQIAAYEGSPERKQYAVNAVRGLRSAGVEAYYYHGETISSVCVGAWPIDAIKRQDRASGGTSTDDNAIPIIPSGPLPPNVSPELHDREGHRLIIEAPKLEVLDPTLAKAIRDYPEHAVNGEVYWRTAKNGQQIPSASFIVLVPHPDNTPVPKIAIHNDDSNAGADQAVNDIFVNPTGQSRAGQLRSIDQP